MSLLKIKKKILALSVIISLIAPNVCMAIGASTSDVEDSNAMQETGVVENSGENANENDVVEENEGQDGIEQEGENYISEGSIDTLHENAIDGEENAEPTEYINNRQTTTIAAPQVTNDPIQTIAGQTIVQPGNGTLQAAINSASEGATLQLERGIYSGDKILINKSVTIRGAGASSGTNIYPKIEIDGTTADTKVVLENFFIGNQQIPTEMNYYFINIKTPVNLEINGLFTNFVYRSNADTNCVTINMEDGSSGSTVNINNSTLYSAINGMKISSSNNNITLNKTFLYGKYAIILENGGNNNSLTIENGSTISGRSSGYYADEAIQIIGQTGLKISIDNSTIQGNDARGDRNTHVFSIDGETTSQNVTIDIKGSSIINDINPIKGSTIFNFGNSTPENNNVVKIERTVKITPNTVAYKYNVSNNYAVVGIYDKYGDATVKTYTKNQLIPENDYNTISSNWYKVTNIAGEFNIKDENVTENMDLYPILEQAEDIKVKIAGQEGEYTIKSGANYASNEELKGVLEGLKKTGDKEFSSFVTQDGTEINENTKIYKDTTITPRYKVTVKIKKQDGGFDEYKIEEGQNLSYIEQENLDKYEKEPADGTKKFSRYRVVGATSKYSSISKSVPIDKNIEIEPIYYVTVKIKVGEQEKTYNIDENESINSYFSSQATLTEIKNFVNSPNKVFQNFIIEGNENEHPDYNTQITKNTTLVAKYKVKVTVYKADGTTEDYLLEEGQKLNDLGPETVEKIEQSMNNGKTITHYVDGNGKKVDFNTQVFENMSFEPVYYDKIKVKIKDDAEDKEYELEDGANLNTLSGEDQNDFMGKVNKTDKTLAHFTNEEGEIVTFETPITEDTTLTPVYNVTITVLPKNGAQEEIEVLDGTTFNDEELQEKLNKYESVDNKTFVEFTYKDNDEKVKDIDKFEKHTTIVPKYTITVTVKTNANEEGTEINNIPENSTIESIKDKLTLYENVTDKQLARYEDESGNEISIDKELTENITIIPIYNVTVTIGGKGYTLQQNNNLASLETQYIKAIEETIHQENKTFSHFVNEDNEPIDFNTPIEKNMELTPKYTITVTVKVNNEVVKTFDMAEGEKLEDKADELKEYKEVTTKQFKQFEYEQGGVIGEGTQLTQHTTIIPKYDVNVIINNLKGSKLAEVTLAEGESLSTKSAELNEIENPNNKIFIGYFEGENKVETLAPIEANKTLVAKYNVTVTINDINENQLTEVTLAEGESLNKKSAELNEIENPGNKTFIGYFEEDSKFDTTDAIEENKTLVAKYNVTVTINDVNGSKLTDVTLEEGESLSTKSTELNSIENPENKAFIGYYDGDSEFDTSTEIRTNKTLVAKYNVTVTINDAKGSKLTEFTLAEGESLSTKSSELNSIENPENKIFAGYYDGANKVETSAPIEVNKTLVAKYNVKVTINDINGNQLKEVTLAEGESLSTKSTELDSIENSGNKTFKGYYDGESKVDTSTAIETNRILVAKYTVNIKIGENSYTVDEGTTLAQLINENPTAKQDLETIKDGGRIFSRYVDENGNTVDETTEINVDTVITPKYFITVTVKGKDGNTEQFNIEEGKTLNDLADEEKAKLEEIKNDHNEGERFAGFVNSLTGDTISENDIINSDVTIEPTYEAIPVTPEEPEKDENNSENKETENANDSNSTNPKTVDNIFNYVKLAILGIVCIIVSKKLNKRKKR